MLAAIEADLRDLLYGYIRLTRNELRLLDTRPLQRLRRIKQLASAHPVYPAACRTHFEHSLGVLHVATLMARQLQMGGDDLTTPRYAALLHDIGHGPFSHVFEASMRGQREGCHARRDHPPDHTGGRRRQRGPRRGGRRCCRPPL